MRLILLSACTCDPMGTLENFGCDQETGYCTCKRYVTGRHCDECYVRKPYIAVQISSDIIPVVCSVV